MTDLERLLAELSAQGVTLARTIAAVEALEPLVEPRREVRIGIASNVSVDLLGTYLRKHALLANVRLAVTTGNHDDALGDATRFAGAKLDAMVFLPFFDNLLPAFEHQAEVLPAAALAAKEADFRASCTLALRAAESLPAVYVACLHRWTPAVDSGREDVVAATIHRFNAILRELAAGFPNVRLIDTASIVEALGAAASFDRRFYLRSTAPYTPAFLDEFARRLVLASRGFGTWFYKVLALDCDNTLWGGVIGEDLLDGIQLDPHSYPGRVYWHAQQALAALERNGVLLCLCSKNNPQDVEEVLDRHPHMVLRQRQITAKKVDWNDKADSLRALALELNIGLESIVFLDDSGFECEAVRAALPQVRVVQVPAALADYAGVLRELRELFLAGGVSAESRDKTEQYRRLRAAAQEQALFATREEYLASLGIRVELKRNSIADIPRISELTQKSNQFNLTTLRQSPGAIRERMEDGKGCVYSLNVSDRFGDAGLTGVVILAWSGEIARVDAFLMSCRVIGRGVEHSFWSTLAADAARNGCRWLEAEFRLTDKNAQVERFYDHLGLALVDGADGVRRYRVAVEQFKPPQAKWIQLHHGE